LAGLLDRPSEDLVNQALRQYLETHAWQIEKISQGIAVADRGEVMAHDDVMYEMVELIAAASKGKAWNSSGSDRPDKTWRIAAEQHNGFIDQPYAQSGLVFRVFAAS